MALISVCKCYNKNYIGICLFALRSFSLNSFPEMNKFKYAAREAKLFNKFLDNQSKKKRKLYFEDSPSDRKFKFDGQYNSSKENSRRIAVMNSLFMKSISDLLMTGNIAGDVLEKGLQISGVKMSPNFNYLNVFWATNNEENAAALEAVLPQLGFTLRHELSQLRVIGIVPRIVFVKDKNYHSALKVEHLLSLADYGEDHVPLPLYSEFKNDPAIDCMNNMGENDENEEEKTFPEETMPVMRQDIFNLDHERIMNKIIKSVQKSRAMHRFQPQLAIDCDGSINNIEQTSDDNMTKQERKFALSKFILDRKLLLEKQNRSPRSESHILESSQNDDFEDEDYLTEDDVEEDYLEEDQKY